MERPLSFRQFAAYVALLGLILAGASAPSNAHGQSIQKWIDRQKHKNDWRNLGYAGAGVAGLGLLTHSPLLVGVGVAGGLYSAYRYEEDRKSQSKMARRRYALFHKKEIWEHGHRYKRVTVMRNGHKYYAFKRA
ncbi:MAG TPA: hypothetical protein VKT78_11935 [Fimbriimonadaceae bacterium]|nr:hypothetical protein [Fimbriimonadaceae bacterium]